MRYATRLEHSLGSPLFATVARWGKRSPIKSIQYGTVTLNNQTSNTATITSVDPNNALILFLGSTYAATTAESNIDFARITLTNATTVTANQNTAIANNTIVSFLVVEFYPGILKSVQRGTMSVTTTSTITAVDTTKAVLFYLGQSTSGSPFDALQLSRITLTNATTITGTGGVGTNGTISWQVAEFY